MLELDQLTMPVGMTYLVVNAQNLTTPEMIAFNEIHNQFEDL